MINYQVHFFLQKPDEPYDFNHFYNFLEIEASRPKEIANLAKTLGLSMKNAKP